jgi:hypothetical protein
MKWVMHLTSLNDVGPSLQALPAAMLFSTQLLLPQKSSVTVKSESLDETMKLIEIRANSLTPILENIEGYRHGGIND